MSGLLPNISRLSVLPGHRLAVSWRDGSEDVVRFAETLCGHPAFSRLLDETEFAKVSIIDWGGGLEWADGIDYAADALYRLALTQRESALAAQ